MINLFTGAERGFLGNNIKKNINGITLDYGNILDKKIINCDRLYHFASPSDDFDFLNNKNTINTIVNGTLNMVDIINENRGKIIFASSIGVESPNNLYRQCKLLMEKYIQDNCNNWVILRIPRIYDKSRKKGLMKKLRLNLVPEKDMNNQIEYLPLNDFIKQTLEVVNQRNIIYNYKNLKCETIANIKKLYI